MLPLFASSAVVADAAPTVKTIKAEKVSTFRAAKQQPVVTYRLKNVRPTAIKKARLSRKGRRQILPLKAVRRAAGKGVLKVRLSKPLVKSVKQTTTVALAAVAPTLVLVVNDKPIAVKPVEKAPALKPVPEAPKPAPAPATTPSGSCNFGSFGGGVVPGACWRPYSDDSPFNRKLPANPPIVPNSDAVVKRILGFGPVQHLTAGMAGGELDSGDPVFWSQATDPEYTVHCLEAWGKCAVEGVKVRIPAQARPAGASDGHMTIVDQATGWEYDFWQVRARPAGGGTLTISWGGRTRIDGDGLDSDGTAAKFGNLAGKLRVEELEAGRIDHALFLAMGCDSGKYVYPAKKTGLSCAEIGQSTADAPAMGSQVMLDMTPAQIDALNVPAWKKTILRALREYGAFFGDTGGAMTIAEESSLSHTVFGQEDKWERFAKANNVPYYAPDDVYVMNMRDGVDWGRYLRVVDPCVAARTC